MISDADKILGHTNYGYDKYNLCIPKMYITYDICTVIYVHHFTIKPVRAKKINLTLHFFPFARQDVLNCVCLTISPEKRASMVSPTCNSLPCLKKL